SVQQRAMAARMARRRDGEEIQGQRDRVEAFQNPLGAGLGGEFEFVNDAPGAETRRVSFGIGNVVAVGEEDVADAAALGEPARQVLDEAWRIDQPVAVEMLDEVAVAAERLP